MRLELEFKVMCLVAISNVYVQRSYHGNGCYDAIACKLINYIHLLEADALVICQRSEGNKIRNVGTAQVSSHAERRHL